MKSVFDFGENFVYSWYMTLREMQNIDKRVEKSHFKGKPMVMIPMEDWKKLEELMEDEEMRNSVTLRTAIEEGMRDIKLGRVFSFDTKTGRFKKAMIAR
ncbi:MAG: hypothetical protein Q7R89_03865 [bacterium]|nr:hypothetical protein [bacterium]